MLVTIDKQGNIKLPSAVRKALGLKSGSLLDPAILPGGHLLLAPVVVYPTVCLSEQGLAKLTEARQSGLQEMPGWLRKKMRTFIEGPCAPEGS